MTLDQLLEKVPAPWRPVVARYGPALLAMSADELWAWIEQVATGRPADAYADLLARLDRHELLDEWRRLIEAWDEANAANARRIATQREAAMAIVKVCLGAALAVVGL